ncbi:MAG: hypothetical protein B6U97_02505 [Candidatus Altiarchaeales archaeon ex4484_96]|nr:MAG: hypothetical protein B6U97_02505 [Candidatus Altiarchaeales archaeon ex4484_96]
MSKIGALVVSYGSRGVSFVDALCRSEKYDVDLFIADKQANPFNRERAKEHRIISDLDVGRIRDFAAQYRDKIDFGIVGSEGPIIDGVRELIEDELDIPMVCPTKEYALEESKVDQRLMMRECAPDANPDFRVFNKKDFKSQGEAKKELWMWLDEMNDEVAVKPDRPGYGKGVGVWGDHFNTRQQLWEHFLSIYEHDSVLVEKKIDGEESSFQCFCDGKRIQVLPATRDYKRAFEGDMGPNTGGMGCYKDKGDYLPFMSKSDRDEEVDKVGKIFRHLRGKDSNDGLRGIPLYVAFIHSAEGAKILEINSRGGDPEIQTLMPLLKDDFVDVCLNMIDGNLKSIDLRDKASVLVYKVPPNYGGFQDKYPSRVDKAGLGSEVDLTGAYKLKVNYGNDLWVYPGSMEVKGDKTFSLSSRTVCCIGVGDSIEEARKRSMEAIESIGGGGLWYRKDIASIKHITNSIEHMKMLRG